MTALKITSVGNSAGVLLPKELLTKLRVDKGDVLHVIETENGIELTPYDPEFDAQMAVGKTSCAKIVTSCANWRNDRANLDQFTRH